jgi:hypothetical protein
VPAAEVLPDDRAQDQEESDDPEHIGVAGELVARAQEGHDGLVGGEEPERCGEAPEQPVPSAPPEAKEVQARDQVGHGDRPREKIDAQAGSHVSLSQMKP